MVEYIFSTSYKFLNKFLYKLSLVHKGEFVYA